MNNQRTAYSRQAWESHYGMIHSVGSLAIIPPLFITGLTFDLYYGFFVERGVIDFPRCS